MKRKASYTSKTSSKKGKFSKAQRSYIKKAVSKSAELKYLDTNANFDGTTEVVCLNLVVQGTEYNNRIGRHIKTESVSLKTYSPITPIAYRWWLVWDKQPNGTLPAKADILNGSFTEKNVAANGDRFVVLRTSYVDPASNGANVDGVVDSFAKIGRDTEFGSLLVPPTHGALLLVVHSITTLSSQKNIAIYSRVRYTDQ